jgi:uncharacterized membrane protein
MGGKAHCNSYLYQQGALMAFVRELLGFIGLIVDVIGVRVVFAGAGHAIRRYFDSADGDNDAFRILRQDLGRAILLRLEFLVAGDIIRTVSVSPTLDNVIVLGLIIIIRTMLSFTLELELQGQWPWQRTRAVAVPEAQGSQHAASTADTSDVSGGRRSCFVAL